jgi:mRNA interferase RelE/StbE
MEYSLSKRAQKILNKVDSITRKRIERGLNRLPEGNVIPLEGSDTLYRLRIGDWRILLSYENVKIEEKEEIIALIVKIDARGGVYKGG